MTKQSEYINAIFDQLRWSLPPFADNNSNAAHVASVHESFHNELNNITGYGCLLQAYAYLANENSTSSDYYKEVLSGLAQRSKTAHESYATWLAITVHKKDIHNTLHREVLENNTEYLYYYNRAESLVRQFKSIFIRQQVLSAVIRMCFQSRPIAEYAIGNLRHFSFSAIRNSEFPDQRFDFITENLPVHFLEDCVERYLQTLDGSDRELVRDAIGGNERRELLHTTKKHISQGLMHFIYEDLRSYFEAANSQSLEDKEHLEYLKEIFAELDSIIPFATARFPLTISTDPHDEERNVLVNFDNQTTFFIDQKPLCSVIRYSKEIFTDNPIVDALFVNNQSFFITARVAAFMIDQYQYTSELDYEYFEKLDAPFVAVRWSASENGRQIVYYLPLEDLATMRNFITHSKKQGKKILCYVSFCAAYLYGDWTEKWLRSFDTQADFACMLMDFSPLTFIEKIFPASDEIRYCYIVNNPGTKRHDALIFEEYTNGELTNRTLMPGTALICNIIYNFISTRYPQYKFFKSVSNPDTQNLSAILHNVSSQEQLFYFHNQNIEII